MSNIGIIWTDRTGRATAALSSATLTLVVEDKGDIIVKNAQVILTNPAGNTSTMRTNGNGEITISPQISGVWKIAVKIDPNDKASFTMSGAPTGIVQVPCYTYRVTSTSTIKSFSTTGNAYAVRESDVQLFTAASDDSGVIRVDTEGFRWNVKPLYLETVTGTNEGTIY